MLFVPKTSGYLPVIVGMATTLGGAKVIFCVINEIFMKFYQNSHKISTKSSSIFYQVFI